MQKQMLPLHGPKEAALVFPIPVMFYQAANRLKKANSVFNSCQKSKLLELQLFHRIRIYRIDDNEQ